jgi:hypothetical protein
MTDAIKWPEKPTCHQGGIHASEEVWCPAGVKLHPTDGTIPAFRTCSYCGSMHHEDLMNAIASGATMGGADWKYGWPHKFYVDKIPNPHAGVRECRASTSRSDRNPMPEEERIAAGYDPAEIKEEIVTTKINGVVENSRSTISLIYKKWTPAAATTHGKWYNEHFKDLEPAAFAALAEVIFEKTKIRFIMDDLGLKFLAPHMGYQA